MQFLAGYHYKEEPGNADWPPLVLLHGSGSTEEVWEVFGETVAPGTSIFAVRGPIAWEAGFAFFRRNPDRTLDYEDLSRQTINLAQFLAALSSCHAFTKPPVIVGFSNGAIIAASLIADHVDLTSGAVLLRPLSPLRDKAPVLPNDYPLLILAALRDSRRDPRDHEIVAAQFLKAGAEVTCKVHDCDHGMSNGDVADTKAWLEEKFQ